MTIDKLRDLAEEERQRCMQFGLDPLQSRRYRSLCRSITIQEEDADPAIQFTKSFFVYILVAGIPVTIWIWFYIISETIKITLNP